MKTAIESIFLFIVTLTLISCKEESSNDCKNNDNYLFITINNESICYSNCFTDIWDMTNVSETSYLSDYINYLFSGEFSIVNGKFILMPNVLIIFPNKITGTYNNDSVRGLDFTVNIEFKDDNYTFPYYSYPDWNLNISTFNLEILQYNENDSVIFGKFDGVLFNSRSESISITNGKFKSKIIKI